MKRDRCQKAGCKRFVARGLEHGGYCRRCWPEALAEIRRRARLHCLAMRREEAERDQRDQGADGADD